MAIKTVSSSQINRTSIGGNVGYVIKIAMAAAMGGLMFGFDIAIIAGAGPLLAQTFALTPIELGWAFSILLFGCALGAAVAGPMCDRFGRRIVMIWVAVLFAVTMVATGLAPDFTTFLMARAAAGLAVGAVSLAAPTYVAEIAPASIRGRLGALYQMSIIIGILVSYLINYGLHDMGADAWRYMFLSGCVPSLVFFVLLLAAPETPRFLVRKGMYDAARMVLVRIEGQANADHALEQIRASSSPPGIRQQNLWKGQGNRVSLGVTNG
jgi:MFS transporter, SP family, arabinose:H+ symporter